VSENATIHRRVNLYSITTARLSRTEMALKFGRFLCVRSNGATTRETIITYRGLPCCSTSSACTSKNMNSAVVHKMLLQETPLTIITIFLNMGHKLSTQHTSQHIHKKTRGFTVSIFSTSSTVSVIISLFK
jgi:hypothetical protein